MEDSDIPTFSGNTMTSVISTSTSTPTTTVATVSLRPEDVQAIVTGLASNPSALAAVALMIQSDQQPALPANSSVSSSRSQSGKLPPTTGSPHKLGTRYSFSSLHTGRE